jgi:hypothetical protein
MDYYRGRNHRSARHKASYFNGKQAFLFYKGSFARENSANRRGSRFMQADPWWSCAMAVNVALVFFNNAHPDTFRRRTWVYCAICFGGPMAAAVTIMSIRDDERGPIFGDAAVSSVPISLLDVLTNTGKSCGAGSDLNGAWFVYTPTTFPFGSALARQFSSTSPWGTASSVAGTSCAVSRSNTPVVIMVMDLSRRVRTKTREKR